MRILVTGGAGFIGSHVIDRLLKSGSESIVCGDSFNDYYDPAIKRANVQSFAHDPRVRVVEADVCDNEAMLPLFAAERFTHVIHLAAYAGVRPSVTNPLLYERNNVGGTLSLLEAARSHPVERFLLVSSSTVYGRGAIGPFVEDAPLGVPLSPYGATKRAAELLGLTYWELHRVPVVCLRPFSVYGPRLRPDLAVAIFSQKIAAGEPIPLFGDGSFRRDFTHVSDICSAMETALDAADVVGEAINLGHNQPVVMRDVIEILAHAIGRPARIDFQPAKAEDMPLTFADLTKAGRLLNYHPRVSFEDGIRDYVAWLRATGQIPS
jgi:UDP-glucuronate 4-epimerase